MATIILIHGAWHGAWCWNQVSTRLREAGHTPIALDLPGHGDNPKPLSGMTIEKYAAYVCSVLAALDTPAILVGHSMGGMVISQAAEAMPDKVQGLVYVCAVLLGSGETLQDPAFADPDSRLAGNIGFSADGSEVTLNPDAITDLFYHDCPTEDADRAASLLCRQSAAPFATPIHISTENFGRIPRYYVECLNDRVLTPSLQKRMYERSPCKQVFSLDCGHSPFFAAPEELTAIMDKISTMEN
jgi:pimeloyl-ACP methyl ester carboxylesterase